MSSEKVRRRIIEDGKRKVDEMVDASLFFLAI